MTHVGEGPWIKGQSSSQPTSSVYTFLRTMVLIFLSGYFVPTTPSSEVGVLNEAPRFA